MTNNYKEHKDALYFILINSFNADYFLKFLHLRGFLVVTLIAALGGPAPAVL